MITTPPSCKPGYRPRYDIVLAVTPFSFQPDGGLHQISIRLLDPDTLKIHHSYDWRLYADSEIAAGYKVDPSIWNLWQDSIRAGDPDAILITSRPGSTDRKNLHNNLRILFQRLDPQSRVWAVRPSAWLRQLRTLTDHGGNPFPFSLDRLRDPINLAVAYHKTPTIPAPSPTLYAWQDADEIANFLRHILPATHLEMTHA